MPLFFITGLTLREAVRRKTILGAFILGLLPLAVSLILSIVRARLYHRVETGETSLMQYAIEIPLVRSTVTTLCLSSIKSLSALFAILLAGGAISGEIERGLLAVVLSKPMHRWQILIGKWIGINIVAMGSAFLWGVLVWFSLSRQSATPMLPVLKAACILPIYPLVVSTVALSLSTFAQRLFGTALAISVAAVSWFDGILNGISQAFEVPSLKTVANIVGLVLPQGYIGWWIDAATAGIVYPNTRGPGGPSSPRYLTATLGPALHIAHLDIIYVVGYILIFLLVGGIVFHRRDV
jgi:ABC-type transport system involved in multi-copper enzyme maturation permease subunit